MNQVIRLLPVAILLSFSQLLAASEKGMGAYLFTFFNTANMNTYRSLGRSDIYLKVEVLRKIVGFIVIFLTMNFGVYALASGEIAVTLISLIINTYPNKNILNYGLFGQCFDMLPNFILTIISAIFAYCIIFLRFNDLLTLLVQVCVFILCYALLSFCIKPPAYCLLKNVVHDFLKRNS